MTAPIQHTTTAPIQHTTTLLDLDITSLLDEARSNKWPVVELAVGDRTELFVLRGSLEHLALLDANRKTLVECPEDCNWRWSYTAGQATYAPSEDRVEYQWAAVVPSLHKEARKIIRAARRAARQKVTVTLKPFEDGDE